LGGAWVVQPGEEVRLESGPRFRRSVEARRSRHRLYPVSVLYTLHAVVVLGLALTGPRPAAALAFALLGIAAWTLLEYKVHRYILHGRFPDGPGPWEHVLHRAFDHLHLEHHKRPWDGNHINGTLKDTLPFAGPVALLALFAPLWSAPAFVAGLLQAYVIEEWVHHSVHFYRFENRYFRYITRHHLYHHSPKGMHLAYGLTNGFWDIVYATRIPEGVRQALYRPTESLSRGGSPDVG